MNTYDAQFHVRSHSQNFPNVSPPPIDCEVLLARCMGNASFAIALLSELEANGQQLAAALVLHATSDQIGTVAEGAHSLKGAAAILGAESLREQAAGIETACRVGEMSRVMKLVLELRSEMERCLTYIPSLKLDLQRREA